MIDSLCTAPFVHLFIDMTSMVQITSAEGVKLEVEWGNKVVKIGGDDEVRFVDAGVTCSGN